MSLSETFVTFCREIFVSEDKRKRFYETVVHTPLPPIERPKIQLSLFDGSLKETFPFVNPAVVVYEEGRTDALKAERVRRKEWPNV